MLSPAVGATALSFPDGVLYEPLGFELPGRAGDEDLEDGDGRDREEHSDRPEEGGSSQDSDHHHDGVKLDRATEDDRPQGDSAELLAEDRAR